MGWLIALCIVSIVANAAAAIAIRNALKGQELLSSYASSLESVLAGLRSRLQDAHNRVKQVDIRGTFEADDEVGFFFKELKKSSEEIDSFVKSHTEERSS